MGTRGIDIFFILEMKKIPEKLIKMKKNW